MSLVCEESESDDPSRLDDGSVVSKEGPEGLGKGFGEAELGLVRILGGVSQRLSRESVRSPGENLEERLGQHMLRRHMGRVKEK